jgi:hypothetical protein
MTARLLPAALVVALLSACASSPTEMVVERLTGGKVEGGRDQAVVHGMDSMADAFPLAVAHCAGSGRKAQFQRRAPGAHVFDCVD